MLPRTLEPEVMDSPEEARDYDSMDHAAVNDVFVADFRAVWNGATPSSTLALAPRKSPSRCAGSSHGPRDRRGCRRIDACRRPGERRPRRPVRSAGIATRGR